MTEQGVNIDAVLQHRLGAIQQRIQAAAAKAQRDPREIRLLPVSKGQSVDAVQAAYRAGLDWVGENYLSEALAKFKQTEDLPLIWHFIGVMQSNKTAAIADWFDWVHSLDRLKIAQRLSAQRPAVRPPLNVCVQVNISKEPQKAGVLPEEALALCRQVARLPGIRLRGVMAMPKMDGDARQCKRSFLALAELKSDISDDLALADFDTLSMGMSGDFELAIACGSTLVRLGTVLFGPRRPSS